MLYIFKTPLKPHPETPGKMVAQNDAGVCQAACHSQVAMCEHDPTVRHEKEGRYLLTLKQQRYLRGVPLTSAQEDAIKSNPDLLLFEGIEEFTQEVEKALDLTPREVIVSPSCVKGDGTPITIDDFPDGWQFGNGVGIGSVLIAESEVCHLSWVVFPDSSIPAVRAAYDTLRSIMESREIRKSKK